jgi:hypothetical protein
MNEEMWNVYIIFVRKLPGRLSTGVAKDTERNVLIF